MFLTKKWFEAKFEKLFVDVRQAVEAVEENMLAQVRSLIQATDPRTYWCGVVYVGKAEDGQPVVLSAGQWLDSKCERATLPLTPVVGLEPGGFVFVYGPCLIQDVYVGNLSQVGGYSGEGMPLCYVHNRLNLGVKMTVRITRLKFPERRGW